LPIAETKRAAMFTSALSLPTRPCPPHPSGEHPEPPVEQLLDPRRELTSPPGVGGALDDLGLGGAGMDDARDLAQADAMGDGQAELGQHVAGVLGDQGGT